MTAKGKITAARVTAGDRILVKHYNAENVADLSVLQYLGAEHALGISTTKTGEGVTVARVLRVEAKLVTGGRRDRRVYDIHTTEGILGNNVPTQTMWLAPEDAAGIKRAHAEALELDKVYEAYPLAEEFTALTVPDGGAVYKIYMRTVQHYAVEGLKGITCQCRMAAFDIETLAKNHQRSSRITPGWSLVRAAAPPDANRHAIQTGGVVRIEPGTPEMTQLVGRVLRTEPLTFNLPALTLHSQDGKVDNMTETSETQTPAETTPAERHTGSSVVKLIEKVWDRIRADHPELPEVVVTTGSGEGVKWGHFRADSWKLEGTDGRFHEFFLASEALAKGAHQVLQTTIHEAAHTISKARGIKDTSRQGRWHNAAFKKAAEELGLEHKGSKADASHGFSFVTLTQATKEKYADLLAELDQELKLTGLLPFWLGGKDEDEKGGERITGKPTKGGGDGTKSGPLKATCTCEEPVIIRLSQKVLDLGVVKCTECDELFTAA